jgi:hypothetical protein
MIFASDFNWSCDRSGFMCGPRKLETDAAWSPLRKKMT